MFTKWRDVVPNMHTSLEWEIVCGVCLFVWPTSCSMALLCFPVPLVDEGWALLLGTSFVVPRRQKVALPVYYLCKFVFSHPGQAHLSWMLKRYWPALFFLCVWWWSPTPPQFWYSSACPSTGPIVRCLVFFSSMDFPTMAAVLGIPFLSLLLGYFQHGELGRMVCSGQAGCAKSPLVPGRLVGWWAGEPSQEKCQVVFRGTANSVPLV